MHLGKIDTIDNAMGAFLDDVRLAGLEPLG
jgi:hypothetical protein